jgi:hypothetical protein
MNTKPQYLWSEENGTAFCTIFYKNYTFTGEAQCHPDDRDMMSKLTGQSIAEARAALKYLRFIRDCELRPQLKSLYQLYYSMKHSNKFTPRGYEAKMLYKQIRLIENNLNIVKMDIKELYQKLTNYIEQKDLDHQMIKEFRAKKKLVENN